MAQRELSSEQIDRLFEFTYRKRVRYYDVQTEIVDHLATAIEELWKTKPDLPFEAALDRVYQSFGIYGFSRIVQARERSIARLGRRELFGFFRMLASPRHAWIPTGLFLVLYYLFTSIDLSRFLELLPRLAIGALVLIAGLIVHFVRQRNRQFDGRKYLLSELPVSVVAAAGGGFHGLFLFIPQLMADVVAGPWWLAAALAAFYTLWFLLLYAAFFYLPQRARELIRSVS